MKLQFLGAAKTVTGSKYLLTVDNQHILVDCGLFQGQKELRLRNWEPFPFQVNKIHAVVLTHAHIDHSGYLPLLVKQGFKGPIYATEATRALCEILLRDSGRIQEEDARNANKHGYSKHKPALPLYTEEDAIEALKLFRTFNFNTEVSISQALSFHAVRAGHILGSAILTFNNSSKTLVFSGDLGRPEDPIMNPPDIITQADYLVLESTYGIRLHSTQNAKDAFAKVVRDTVARGGTVIIPAFAVGRAQTVLYLLYQLKEDHEIPNIPIYMDSPMAEEATDLMLKYSHEHRLSPELCRKICQSVTYLRSADDSKRMNDDESPKVIISASGMAEGGRVLHHIMHFGTDPKNSIVFVGYQAKMTRGDYILHGAKEVKIYGKMVPIRAHYESIDSLSSHTDYKETIQWLHNLQSPPKEVFLIHGEEESAEGLKSEIVSEFGWNVMIPDYLQEVTLS